MVNHTCANVRSHMDFGPAVKPLGITVKKEAGRVVKTSGEIDVVKLQAIREFKKGVITWEPQKRGPKDF